jgi:hypothetical protein
MTNPDDSAAQILGLNLTGDSELHDPHFNRVLREFVVQLDVIENGNVILSDPYALSVHTDELGESALSWCESLSSLEHHKLLLLSILSRPFDSSSLWPADRDRLVDDEVFRWMWSDGDTPSLAHSLKSMPHGLDGLGARRQVLSDPSMQALVNQIPVRMPIKTFSSEFIGGQPGNYDYQMWQVARWSDDWCVVYGVTDAAREEGYPFPWVLGFCRLLDAERNFVRLLHAGWTRFDIGFYYTYGRISGDWPLAKLALVAEDGDEGPAWVPVTALLTLSNEHLEGVLTEADDPRFIGRLRAVLEFCDDYESLSIHEICEAVGERACLSHVEQYIEDNEEQIEASAAVREKQRQLRLEPFRDKIQILVDRKIGTSIPPKGRFAAMGRAQRRAKRAKLIRELEDYALANNRLPLDET